MKHIRSFSLGFIVAAFLLWGGSAFAGVAGFKTALIAAFTANFTASQRAVIANSFVSAHQDEWNRRVAGGTVDSDATRGIFAADKVTEYVQDVVRSEQYKIGVRAVPLPTPLPDNE